MSENLQDHGNSLAAPFIFLIVLLFQFVSTHVQALKKNGSKTAEEVQLRTEIRQLLKEASLMSQPSTFAQAAKLKRSAAAKEKELAKIQEMHDNEVKLSFDTYTKGLMIVKVVTYLMLILWFWRMPVAAISERLVQPFGKILSWRAGGTINDNVMVGIIPWLIVSTRVSKIVIRKFYT